MQQLSTTAHAALRQILESQPTTPAKVAFAWRMAAGEAVDRATETHWRPDGVLVIRSSADAWRREVRNARGVLLRRMQELVGADVVVRLVIE